MPGIARRTLVAVPALAHPAIARAQRGRVIRLVVPFPPGGLTDIVARMVAQHMQQSLDQGIIVENRPGGNAIIGTEAVARAPRDGSVVLVGSTAGLPLNALLRPGLSYRTEDFTPIGLLFDGPLSLTLNAGLPPRSVAEFVAFARSRGMPLRYSTNGPGSVGHLFGILMAQAMGIRLTDVAYRGNGPSTTDLLAGVIEIGLEAPTTTIEHIRAGKLRLLALSCAERTSLFPEVPTFQESGYPDLVAGFWTGLLCPMGTPAGQVARLNAAAREAMESAPIRERLVAEALRPIGGPPGLLEQQIASDLARWGRVIRENRITLD